MLMLHEANVKNKFRILYIDFTKNDTCIDFHQLLDNTCADY